MRERSVACGKREQRKKVEGGGEGEGEEEKRKRRRKGGGGGDQGEGDVVEDMIIMEPSPYFLNLVIE